MYSSPVTAERCRGTGPDGYGQDRGIWNSGRPADRYQHTASTDHYYVSYTRTGYPGDGRTYQDRETPEWIACCADLWRSIHFKTDKSIEARRTYCSGNPRPDHRSLTQGDDETG